VHGVSPPGLVLVFAASRSQEPGPTQRPRPRASTGWGASCFNPSLFHDTGGVYEKLSLSAVIASLMVAGVQAADPAADPEFQNECTMGLATKKHIPTDCSVMWKSESGKTYCFGNEEAKSEFLKDKEGNLNKAEVFWSQPEAH
jgi:YHS domain-containing protein